MCLPGEPIKVVDIFPGGALTKHQIVHNYDPQASGSPRRPFPRVAGLVKLLLIPPHRALPA